MMAFKDQGVDGNVKGVEFLLKKNKIDAIRGSARIAAPGKHARAEERARGWSYRRRFGSVLTAHRTQLAFFSESELSRLGGDGFSESGDSSDELNSAGDTLDAAMRLDLVDYMPGDILTKIDRASMAHGLELRAPFLDVDLASFCIALPARLKVDTDVDKRILRRAFESSWPETIRSRHKQGFGAPMADWLASASVAELVGDCEKALLHCDLIADGLFARQLLHEGTTIQRWALAVLSIWLSNRVREVAGT